MNNRLTQLFSSKQKNILNVYFTAGYPQLEDTVTIAKALEAAGVDIIEIGVPFSDPLADGPVIQHSSEVALKNGMTTKKLFEQLKEIREHVSIPILLMGYINPIIHYGIETFCKKAAAVGVDGLILPDLPFHEYNAFYKTYFENNNLSNILLVTPQTSDKRLKEIDESASGFLYIVSTNSTTGNDAADTGFQQTYFERIKNAGLKNPTLIGFNIKDNETFTNASSYATGAIIGSAFIKAIEESKDHEKDISAFVAKVRGEKTLA